MSGRGASPSEVGTQGEVREHRLPHSRSKLDYALGRVLADTLQDIDEVGVEANALEAAGHQQALDDSDALGPEFGPREQPVSPSGGDRQFILPMSDRTVSFGIGGIHFTGNESGSRRLSVGRAVPLPEFGSSSDSGSGQVRPCTSAQRRCVPTVAGKTCRLRAIARGLKPAAWYSRRTSRILRMDNLLFATAVPSRKIQGESHSDRLSRVAQLRGSDPIHRSGPNRKSDHLPTGITVHFAPDSMVTFHRNYCSLSTGFGDHFAPEYAVVRAALGWAGVRVDGRGSRYEECGRGPRWAVRRCSLMQRPRSGGG